MMKHHLAACCWPMQRLSLAWRHFAFLDTEEYLADQLLVRRGVRVRFGDEYHAPDAPYLVIFCKCRKRDADAFLAAMEELPGKMLLLGHADFPDCCRKAGNLLYGKRRCFL